MVKKELGCISMIKTENGGYVLLDSLDTETQKYHMKKINLSAAEAIAQSKGLKIVLKDETQ